MDTAVYFVTAHLSINLGDTVGPQFRQVEKIGIVFAITLKSEVR